MVKKLCSVLVLLYALATLTACTAPKNNAALLELNENSNFNGIKLGMTAVALQEELGEADAVNPTNAGQEYTYHSLDLSALVDDEQLIRRLSSKNADFNIFTIKIDDDLEAAGEVLAKHGYTRDAASGWRYNNNEVQIILLTIDGQKIVGFSAEWLDN